MAKGRERGKEEAGRVPKGAHLAGSTGAAGPPPLPARDERGEGWGEGFVHAVTTRLDTPLPDPLPTPSSWGEGKPFVRNGGTKKTRLPKAPAESSPLISRPIAHTTAFKRHRYDKPEPQTREC